MKKIILIFAGILILFFENNAQTVKDFDGNVYNTITIGNQVWMKENLNVTHYRNGVAIPNIIGDGDWFDLTTGAYCDFYHRPDSSKIYGRLYNWYAVSDTNGLAPSGWHIPSDSEWTVLCNYLGGIDSAGRELKETGILHWANPADSSTNSTGFTALGGGHRYSAGFWTTRHNGYWWCSSDKDKGSAYFVSMSHLGPWVYFDDEFKQHGMSVRCLKDDNSDIENKNTIPVLQIFPNPATDKLFIRSKNEMNSVAIIFNPIGEIVLKQNLSSNSNEIDISSLKTGIYFIHITSNQDSYQHKFFKK